MGASGLAQVVEAYWLLTGQVDAARRLPKEPKVALTQSIGGLGNNNLVTILVPASRPLHQPGSWQTSFSLPLSPLAPPRPEPPPGEVTGKVLACTLLHTPPEGFTAPLGLAMVRTAQGWLTLAHTDPEHQPALGSTVLLRLEGGLFRAVQVGDLAGTWLRTRSAWRRLPTSLRLWRRRFSR
ncbi:MAG: hypothetical protein HY794_10585 [Desulfarculus sp.]|nr:hypothetical protein [Desulfarculus sp.]